MSALECAPQYICARKELFQIQEKCKVFSSQNDAAQSSYTEGLAKKMKSAFMNRIVTISYENTDQEFFLPEIFLNKAFGPLQDEVNSFLKVNFALKLNIKLHAIYSKPIMKEFESNLLKVKIFKTDLKDIFCIEDLEKEFPTLVKNIIQTSNQFQANEGGWTLLQLVKVEFNLNKYQPLKGATYIPLPEKVTLKRACINVKNKDEYCFKWALVAAIYFGADKHAKQGERPSTYNVNISSETIELKGHILNFRGLCFPLKVKDISIFEENNPGISINVFGYDKENDLVVGPYYKSKKKKDNHINLLFFEDTIKKRTVGHYVWIRNFSRLVRAQITGCSSRVTICDTCLQHIYGREPEKHNCEREDEIAVEEDECVLQFKNYVKTVDVPFVIYAKSECLQNGETCNPVPYALTYFIKCSYDDNLSKWCSFKGPDALREFAESLIKDAKYYYSSYSIKVVSRIPLSAEERLEYRKNHSCCICSRKIWEQKVKLHCRLSGRYKGPAHHGCALNYRIPKKWPVIFYNLSYYESLSFIKVFNDINDDLINVRPLNNDANVCFTKNISLDIGGKLELRFLSLSMFMPFSLNSLVQNMQKSDFKTLKLIHPDDENKFNLVLRRGALPYNYLNCVEKLTVTSLPSIDHFYNNILDKACSPEDYAQAKNIWSAFGCETLEDYLLLCIKIDVILLIDTFENFRLICKCSYNLDPCNYHSATELTWDAMFKMTDIKIKLLNDKSMLSFIKQAMRGPISQCFQNHSVANNKYLIDYNDKLPSKYVMCFHANDLYGRVMSEPLPDGNFEWETDIENFSLDSVPNDSNIGYILEVDLQYPNEFQDIHKIFPFCVENINSTEANENFTADLKHTYNYIIYYKNLQQCLKHGLKLAKIHRILKFNQSDWLKKYISLNKTYKANAKTAFEVNFFDLMNNALYEKIMGKVEKKIRIMQKWESEGKKLGARAFILNPEFSSVTIFDENTVAVELNTNPYRYMPIYLEFVITELAKLKMYSFHYEYMIPKYKTNLQLNYIDTDCVIYTITTKDLYKDITNDIYLMINTLDRNPINDSRLALKTLGMMKDANDGDVVKEFLGLRSKLYSLKAETMRETNESNILENYINTSLSDYKDLLYNKQIYCDNINLFKIKLHQRYTKLFNDLYLSYLDDNNRYSICKKEINNDKDDTMVVE